MSEINKKKIITVKRTNDLNIEFSGYLEANISSDPNEEKNEPVIHLYLFRTDAGNYVCQRITTYPNSIREPLLEGAFSGDPKHGCTVNKTDVIYKFFGYSDLAKQLYDEAHLDYAIRVQ